MELQVTSRNCHKPYAFRVIGGRGERSCLRARFPNWRGSQLSRSEFCVVRKARCAMAPTASRWSIIGRVRVRFQAKPFCDEQSTPLKHVSIQVPGFFPCQYHSINVPYSVFICHRHSMLAIDGVVK